MCLKRHCALHPTQPSLILAQQVPRGSCSSYLNLLNPPSVQMRVLRPEPHMLTNLQEKTMHGVLSPLVQHLTPFRFSPIVHCLERFPQPTSTLPRNPRIQRGPCNELGSVGEVGDGYRAYGSAHRIKISAIRNPIPEPPPVMKATLSLRTENKGLLKDITVNSGSRGKPTALGGL